MVEMFVRKRLPDPQRERALASKSSPEPRRSESAVLVVDGRHAARLRQPDPGPHRLHVLVVRDAQVELLEAPGRLLAEDAGRLAAPVELDDAPVDSEIAVSQRKTGRVQPERVVV